MQGRAGYDQSASMLDERPEWCHRFPGQPCRAPLVDLNHGDIRTLQRAGTPVAGLPTRLAGDHSDGLQSLRLERVRDPLVVRQDPKRRGALACPANRVGQEAVNMLVPQKGGPLVRSEKILPRERNHATRTQ